MFHRLRAEEGLVGPVDVYEVLSLDGTVRETLFLSMYHPRKSKKVPRGYTYARELDSSNMTYGVNHIVENFPQKLDAHIRKWQMEMLGVPLPVHRVREAINGSRFHVSTLNASEQAHPLSQDRLLREDFLKLVSASQDPRFKGKPIAMGVDGIVRARDARISEEQPDLGDLKRRIFQIHRYDGSKPIEQWALSRLRIVSVQSAYKVRAEVRNFHTNLVQNYWHECTYLAYFFLTLALMKANFRGNPTLSADEVVRGTLNQLLRVKFEGEPFVEGNLERAIADYQTRYAQYWSHLRAITAEANGSEIASYSLHLTHIFTGTRDALLIPKFLVLSNGIFSLMASSVQELAKTVDEVGSA